METTVRPRLRRNLLRYRIVAATLSCLCLLRCAPDAADPPRVLAFKNVTVIDGTGADPRPDLTVVVAGNRIETIAPSVGLDLPSSARIVDGRGKFLIPGLWDMHAHTLWDPEAARTFLPLCIANGVTGVRDMGGTLDAWKSVREAIDAGTLIAPRLFVAGRILDGPEPVDPSISEAVATAEDARRVVRELSAAGVDFIKVYTLLPREAFFAAVDEAARLGLPVAGHVPAEVSPVEAAEAGMASIEHMQAETGGYCASDEAASCHGIFEAFRRHHTWQVPTLAVRRARAFVDDPALVADPRLDFVARAALDYWTADRDEKLGTRPESYFAEIKEQYRNELWLAGALHEAGIPLLAGSDAGAPYSLPGFTLHDELALLVEAGLTPMEALRAASSNAAELLGMSDDAGTIEEGKLADLVLLDADPLESIANTRRIDAVVQDGRLWERADLDRLLADVRNAASGRNPRR